MKKFMSKKAIAILLALVMVIGMLPMTMFAASAEDDLEEVEEVLPFVEAEHGFVFADIVHVEDIGSSLALVTLPETGYELTGMEVEIKGDKKIYTLKDMTKSGNLYVLPDVKDVFKMTTSNTITPWSEMIKVTPTFSEVTVKDFAPEMAAQLTRMDEIFGTSAGTAEYALTNWLNNKSYGNLMNYYSDTFMLFAEGDGLYFEIAEILDTIFKTAPEKINALYEALEEAEESENLDKIAKAQAAIDAFEARYEMAERFAATFVDRVSEPLMVSMLVAESIMKGGDLLAAYTTAEFMLEGSAEMSTPSALFPLFQFISARYGIPMYFGTALGDSAEGDEEEEVEKVLLPMYADMTYGAAMALETIGYTVMFSDAGAMMLMMESGGGLPFIPPFLYSGNTLNTAELEETAVLNAEPQLGNGMGVYFMMMMSMMMGNGAPTGYTNFRSELKANDAAIKAGTFVQQDIAALFEARMDTFLDSIESAGDKAFYRMMGVYIPGMAEKIMGLDSAKEAYEDALKAYQDAVKNDEWWIDEAASALQEAKEDLLMSTIFTDGIKIDPVIREALKGSYKAWLEDENLDYALTEGTTGIMYVMKDTGLAKTLSDLMEDIEEGGPAFLFSDEVKAAYFTVVGEFFYESLAQLTTFMNTVTPNTPAGLMAYERFFLGSGMAFTGGQNELGMYGFHSWDPYFAPLSTVFNTIAEWSVFDLEEEYIVDSPVLSYGRTVMPGTCAMALMQYVNAYIGGKTFTTSALETGALAVGDRMYKEYAISHIIGEDLQTGGIVTSEYIPAHGAAMLALAQAYYTSLREQLHPCVTLKSLTPKDGESMWMTVGDQKFLFKFEQKNGGWLISLDESMIPELKRNPYFLQKEVPGKLKGYYLSMDTTTKVGQATLTWTAKEDATVWNYSNGSFYHAVTDSTKSGGFWFLFWYIPFGGVTTTTNYYLSTMIPGEKLATKYTAAQPYSLTPASSHTFTKKATPLYNGTHVYTCDVCGDIVIKKCDYDEQGFCVCGAVNPDMEETAIRVTATAGQRTVYGWFWTSYTMHTVTLTVTEGTAQKIEYSTDDGKTWRTGSTVSSNVKIGEFLVRVTDSVGAIHHYTYTNGALIGDTCRISLAFKEDGVAEELMYVNLIDYPTGKIVRGETVKVNFPYFSIGGMSMPGSALSVYVDGEPLELGEEYTVRTVMNQDIMPIMAILMGLSGGSTPYDSLMMLTNEITIPGQYVTGDVSIVVNNDISSFLPIP